MLMSTRLPALLEEVEGFCQPQVIQGGDSQVMNSSFLDCEATRDRSEVHMKHASKKCKDIWKRLGVGRKGFRKGAGSQGKGLVGLPN
jgi:hypothetical protein